MKFLGIEIKTGKAAEKAWEEATRDSEVFGWSWATIGLAAVGAVALLWLLWKARAME